MFLPGFKKAGGTTLTLALRDYAVSTGGTITVPAAAQVDDLAVLWHCAHSSDDVVSNNSAPSGWPSPTNNVDNISTNAWIRQHYKKLVLGDLNAAINVMYAEGTNELTNSIMLIFSPGKLTPTYTASAGTIDTVVGNPVSQSVAASGQTPPLVVLGFAARSNSGSSGSAAFSTASPAFGATVMNGSSATAGYKIYTSSPSSHTIDMNDLSDANFLAGMYIRIT